MSAPYTVCQSPWRYWHCPELEHCSRKDHHSREQGSSVPSVPQPSPLHCTSTRGSQCPVGLYLPALFALDAKTHAHARTNTGSPTSTPARTTGNDAHMHTRKLALGREGHSHMRRWVRRHGGHESSGDQRTRASTRRPSSTRCKRKSKAKQSKAPLDLAA